MFGKKAQPRSHDLQGVHFSLIAALMESSWPIGEPRRVASLGLTLQRSGPIHENGLRCKFLEALEEVYYHCSLLVG